MMHIAFLALLCAVACKSQDKAKPAPSSNPTASVTPAPPEPSPTTEAAVQTVKTDMPPATEIATLVKGNNNFALDLWARASGTGNVAMSPLSVSTALAMAWAGAKGATADEMRKVMHLAGEPDVIVSQWARVSYALQDQTRPLKLKMANRLYGDASYQFDTTYYTITRKAFDAAMEMVDFIGQSEQVRQQINAWVADKTEQRIKDLLRPQSITRDTRLVVVNAIYFLADWADKFDAASTAPRAFHVSATQQRQVPTMHRQGSYAHAKIDGAALLELLYQANSAAMYVLLPDKVDGLAALERDLPAKLRALQSKLSKQTVNVALPKFTIDPVDPMRLGPPLQALGMKLAFDPVKADFTGMAKPPNDTERLAISEVVHKAFVKVDEQGTEAAAATAVAGEGAGAPPKAIAFTADHPFLFLIVDRASGLILFIGRVVEPRS